MISERMQRSKIKILRSKMKNTAQQNEKCSAAKIKKQRSKI